jgi:hypothetical protein
MTTRWITTGVVVLAVAATALAFHYRVRVSSLELELETSAARIRSLQQEMSGSPQIVRQVEVLPERRGDAEEIERLRAELAAQADAAVLADAAPPAQPAQPPPRRGGPEDEAASGTNRNERENRVSYMERLKQTDPKRYEEIRTARKETAERVNNIVNEQYRFLASLDVSAFPEEQQQGHQQILARLAKVSEAVGNIDPENTDSHGIGHEVFREMHDIFPLLATERQMLLYDTALRAGYKGEAAQEFVDYVEYIDSMTSPRGIMRGMGGMGGRGGGPPREGGGSGDSRPRP